MTSAAMRVCLCELGGQRVAIPVEAVEEVFTLGKLTAVPGAPPWVIGATSRRGSVVPVLTPILVPEAEPEPGCADPGRPALTLRAGALLAAIPIDATHGIHTGTPDPDRPDSVVCDDLPWTLLSPATLARTWREGMRAWATTAAFSETTDPSRPETSR